MNNSMKEFRLKAYLWKCINYFHKPKTFKNKHFNDSEKKEIYKKIVTFQKLHSEIKRCKNYILTLNDAEEKEQEKWFVFIDLKTGAMNEIVQDLNEIYNVKLTKYQIWTGYINVFEIIPDIL